MSQPQPSVTVRFDATNPGQFFACCGLLELCHRLLPDDTIEGWFVYEAFCIRSSTNGADVFTRVLASLLETQIIPVHQHGDEATRPVYLDKFAITLDCWIDDRGRKSPLKLWAGQQTSLGIVEGLRKALSGLADLGTENLFYSGKALMGRFGFDPRAAWNALDVGFSPNEQEMEVQTFPAVELLAAVGLQRFVPVRLDPAAFRYATWTEPLPVSVARGASTGLLPVRGLSAYRFGIVSRGSYKGFSDATLVEGGRDYGHD